MRSDLLGLYGPATEEAALSVAEALVRLANAGYTLRRERSHHRTLHRDSQTVHVYGDAELLAFIQRLGPQRPLTEAPVRPLTKEQEHTT